MDEISALHREVELLKKDRRAEVQRAVDEKLAERKHPPLSQMTRLQKRYFLEPWMTAIALTFGMLALSAFVLALFTPLHTEFGLLGALLVLVSLGFLTTKLCFMDWNSRTEGSVQSPSRDRNHSY